MRADLRANPTHAAQIGRIVDRQLAQIDDRLTSVQSKQRNVLTQRLDVKHWSRLDPDFRDALQDCLSKKELVVLKSSLAECGGVASREGSSQQQSRTALPPALDTVEGRGPPSSIADAGDSTEVPAMVVDLGEHAPRKEEDQEGDAAELPEIEEEAAPEGAQGPEEWQMQEALEEQAAEQEQHFEELPPSAGDVEAFQGEPSLQQEREDLPPVAELQEAEAEAEAEEKLQEEEGSGEQKLEELQENSAAVGGLLPCEAATALEEQEEEKVKEEVEEELHPPAVQEELPTAVAADSQQEVEQEGVETEETAQQQQQQQQQQQAEEASADTAEVQPPQESADAAAHSADSAAATTTVVAELQSEEVKAEEGVRGEPKEEQQAGSAEPIKAEEECQETSSPKESPVEAVTNQEVVESASVSKPGEAEVTSPAVSRSGASRMGRQSSSSSIMRTTLSSMSLRTELAQGVVGNLVDESIDMLATTLLSLHFDPRDRASTCEALDSSRSLQSSLTTLTMEQMEQAKDAVSTAAVPTVPVPIPADSPLVGHMELTRAYLWNFYERLCCPPKQRKTEPPQHPRVRARVEALGDGGTTAAASQAEVAKVTPEETEALEAEEQTHQQEAHHESALREDASEASQSDLVNVSIQVVPATPQAAGPEEPERASSKQAADGTLSQPISDRGQRLSLISAASEDGMVSRRSRLLSAIEDARPKTHSSREPDEVVGFGSIVEVVEAQAKEYEAAASKAFHAWQAKAGLEMIECQSTLCRALRMVGFRYTDSKLVDEIVAADFNNEINFDEVKFDSFANSYRTRLTQRCMDLFTAADEDNSNSVSMSELSHILRSMSIMHLPGVVEDLMRGVAGGLHAGVTFRQFLRIYEVLGPTRGFRSDEYERIMTFCRYGSGAAGDRSSQGRVRLFLEWFGAVQATIDEILANTPQEVTEEDLLEAACQFREKEAAQVQSVFSDADTELSGMVQAKQLLEIIQNLGYKMVWPEVIDEIVEACHLSNREELLFEEVCLVVQRFRERHALPQAELDEIHSTFERHSKENAGFMSCNELVAALHWLGFVGDVEEFQSVFEILDTEDNDYVGEQEFVLAAARFYYRDFHAAHETFITADLDRDGYLTQHEVRMALLHFSYMPKSQRMTVAKSEATADKKLDKMDFARLLSKHRTNSRCRIQENEGFDEKEVKHFKTQFLRYCSSGEEEMSEEGKATFIKDLSHRIFHKLGEEDPDCFEAMSLMKVADPNGEGCLDFAKYLMLMRLLEDLQVMERVRHEKAVVRKHGFSPTEVSQLRQLFHQFDKDNSQELAVSEVKAMISKIIPLDNEGARELASHLQAVDESTNNELDFPEFLGLIKRLQDANWRNINEIPV